MNDNDLFDLLNADENEENELKKTYEQFIKNINVNLRNLNAFIEQNQNKLTYETIKSLFMNVLKLFLASHLLEDKKEINEKLDQNGLCLTSDDFLSYLADDSKSIKAPKYNVQNIENVINNMAILVNNIMQGVIYSYDKDILNIVDNSDLSGPITMGDIQEAADVFRKQFSDKDLENMKKATEDKDKNQSDDNSDDDDEILI